MKNKSALMAVCMISLGFASLAQAGPREDRISELKEQIYSAGQDATKWRALEDSARGQYDMANTVASVGNYQLSGGNRNADRAAAYWNHCTDMRAAAERRQYNAQAKLDSLLGSQ